MFTSEALNQKIYISNGKSLRLALNDHQSILDDHQSILDGMLDTLNEETTRQLCNDCLLTEVYKLVLNGYSRYGINEVFHLR